MYHMTNHLEILFPYWYNLHTRVIQVWSCQCYPLKKMCAVTYWTVLVITVDNQSFHLTSRKAKTRNDKSWTDGKEKEVERKIWCRLWWKWRRWRHVLWWTETRSVEASSGKSFRYSFLKLFVSNCIDFVLCFVLAKLSGIVTSGS